MISYYRCVYGLLLLLGSTGCAATAQAPLAMKTSIPIVIGSSHKLSSLILSDGREINVWTPPGYEKTRDRYDVLYLLDGALSQDFQHISGLAHLGALSGTYSSFIVVGIETKNRRAELTAPPSDPRYLEAFPESGGAEKFRQFISKEVFPFVEGRYRIGKRRALVGESLAGYFVVDTLLKRPEMFDDYIAVSPSLWWDDQALTNQADKLMRSVRPDGKRLYLAVGNEGGTMQKALDSLIATIRESAPSNFKLRYDDKSATETHSTIFHGATLDALRWLYSTPPYDYGPTPWFMIEGATPPKKPSS